MRSLLCLGLILSSLLAGAQVALWTRVYASPTSFIGIGVNSAGDIYCFGDKVYSASDTDAIVVKYDHAGTFQWFREEGTSALSNAIGGAVSEGALSELIQVAHNYRPAGSTVFQSRFNGYAGTGTTFSPYSEAATTCMGIVSSGNTSYRVSRRKTNSTTWHLLISIKGGSVKGEPVTTIAISPNDTVNDMIATPQGLYLLYGTDGFLTTTSNARLIKVNIGGLYIYNTPMGHATHLAHTDYGPDYLFTAGRTGTKSHRGQAD